VDTNETTIGSIGSHRYPDCGDTLATIKAITEDKSSLNNEMKSSAEAEEKAKHLTLINNHLSQQKTDLRKNLMTFDMNFDNLNTKSLQNTSIQRSDKKSSINKILFESNESIGDLVDTKGVAEECDETMSDSTNDTIIQSMDSLLISNDGKASAKWSSNAINYLNIKLSHKYRYSSDCLHLYHKTIVVQFRRQSLIAIRYRFDDFRAIGFILELMDINRRCFEKNSSNDSETNPKWKTISDQMRNNGFDEWTPSKCKNGFRSAIDLYKKVLKILLF